MADRESKSPNNSNPTKKTQKSFIISQLLLRLLTFLTTLVSAFVTITNKQTIQFGVFTLDAKYSYDPNFKFFAYANIAACAFTVLSMLFLCVVGRGANSNHHFLLFLHDLVMMGVVLAGSAAATAIGLLSKYGNVHTGWMSICDHFDKFCNRGTISMIFSYLSLLSLLVLTIMSAHKSRNIHV